MERGMFGRGPVLMTRDAVLVESVQRLAAVVGVDVAIDVDGRAAWSSAPLVLVGSDLAATLVSMHLPRRPGVVIIGVGAPTMTPGAGQVSTDGQVWPDAVALGAEHVIVLPDAEGWLIQRLGEAADGPVREGRCIAVLSASGGVGVSTLAVGLAVASVDESLRTVLIDADARGGGLDLLMGAETLQGIRWPDLAEARGRLSSSTLDYALPHPGGVALLSHARPVVGAVADDAARAVIDACLRGYDRVILDLRDPRLTGAMFERVHDACVVIPATIRGIGAGLAILDDLRGLPVRVHPVIRAVTKGVPVADVRQVIGGDPSVLPASDAVVARANQGEVSLPNDAFGKAVRAIAWSLQPTLDRAA